MDLLQSQLCNHSAARLLSLQVARLVVHQHSQLMPQALSLQGNHCQFLVHNPSTIPQQSRQYSRVRSHHLNRLNIPVVSQRLNLLGVRPGSLLVDLPESQLVNLLGSQVQNLRRGQVILLLFLAFSLHHVLLINLLGSRAPDQVLNHFTNPRVNQATSRQLNRPYNQRCSLRVNHPSHLLHSQLGNPVINLLLSQVFSHLNSRACNLHYNLLHNQLSNQLYNRHHNLLTCHHLNQVSSQHFSRHNNRLVSHQLNQHANLLVNLRVYQ